MGKCGEAGLMGRGYKRRREGVCLLWWVGARYRDEDGCDGRDGI